MEINMDVHGTNVAFRIGGLSDEPDVKWLSGYTAKPGYKILLCHHPEFYPAIRKETGESMDIIVSGHAHGGQWRLFGRGLYAPGQGFLPRYTSGCHGNMVISRGVANTASVPRLGNPPEIPVLKL